MRGRYHALLGPGYGCAGVEHIDDSRPIGGPQRPFDGQLELFGGMSTQQAVVPGHHMDFIEV